MTNGKTICFSNPSQLATLANTKANISILFS
jgi:hypothetical protein